MGVCERVVSEGAEAVAEEYSEEETEDYELDDDVVSGDDDGRRSVGDGDYEAEGRTEDAGGRDSRDE